MITTVHFSILRKLFKPFRQLPKQAINTKLGGVEPGPLSYNNEWTVQEIDFFKRKTAKADKNFVFGMVMKRLEVRFFNAKFNERTNLNLKMDLNDFYRIFKF